MKILKSVNLIIFDLDGTLVNAYPAIIQSFNHTMRAVGAPVRSPRVIRRAVGWGDRNLLKPFVKAEVLETALSLYRRHHRQALPRLARLIPGVKRLLKELKKRGYKIAVASNRPTRFTRIIIRHLGISPCFDYVLCADKLLRGKPHPDILLSIMKRFSAPPGRTIYVGDMTIDVQAGRRAGVRIVAVTGGSHTRKELKQESPDLILRGVIDLPRYL
jgi:phosphoglycolate phosphatase